MRLGIGLGLFKAGLISAGVRIFSAFQTRVIGDGGTVEAGTCVVNGINGSSLLQQASLLLIPSGYKANKLYSEIPTNGNGDLTWTRTSTAIRTNSSGLLESMGTGVPRLSYMYGSCPSALLEPQRTNLALYSQQFDDAFWVKTNSSVTANTTTSPDGSSNADSLIDNSTNGIHALTAQNMGGAGTYAFSFYAKANTLSRVAVFTNSGVNLNLAITPQVFDLSSGTVVNTVTGITATITSVGNGWFRCQCIIPSSGSGSYLICCVSGGTTTSYIGSGQSLFLYGAQLELGAYPTTYIPTTSATATRVADSFSRSNIYTNGLISASGGTWFMELRNNVAYTRDNTQGMFIGDGTTSNAGNQIIIRATNGGRLALFKCIAGVPTQIYGTASDNLKLSIKWDGTSADVFANGTKVVSATSFTTTNMENLIGLVGTPLFIQQMALHPEPLTDAKLIELTTL